MVYRGKPSKGCERCRSRRAKCDIKANSCGQCMRAGVICSGYRDIQQLRIQNDTQSVASKFRAPVAGSPQIRYLPLSIDFQARTVFFAHYVTETRESCWNFLEQFYDPARSSAHLALAIDAVSLAYLWHEIDSTVALVNARKSYGSALRMTRRALRSPPEAMQIDTLIASLVLDIFEKITDNKSGVDKRLKSHMNGALSLVKLRGFESFRGHVEFCVLVKLVNNYLASCLLDGSPAPKEFREIKEFVENQFKIPDFTLEFADVLEDHAKLRRRIRSGAITDTECIAACTELGARIQAIELRTPQSWQYTTTVLAQKSKRAFDLYYHTYRGRNKCLARNNLRIARLFLNEKLIDLHSGLVPGLEINSLVFATAVRDSIKVVCEICASVPQYTDCEGAVTENSVSHITHKCNNHSPDQKRNCYSLIFPLYAAGKSKAVPGAKYWIINQLRYIASHFNIRNADVVAHLLERDADLDAWDVFRIIGSYAIN